MNPDLTLGQKMLEETSARLVERDVVTRAAEIDDTGSSLMRTSQRLPHLGADLAGLRGDGKTQIQKLMITQGLLRGARH